MSSAPKVAAGQNAYTLAHVSIELSSTAGLDRTGRLCGHAGAQGKERDRRSTAPHMILSTPKSGAACTGLGLGHGGGRVGWHRRFTSHPLPTYPSRRRYFHIWVRNLLMNSAPYPPSEMYFAVETLHDESPHSTGPRPRA